MPPQHWTHGGQTQEKVGEDTQGSHIYLLQLRYFIVGLHKNASLCMYLQRTKRFLLVMVGGAINRHIANHI